MSEKNLPVGLQLQVDGLKQMVHKPILDELRALRATRGQREVGSVRVPAHLQSADVVTIASPQADPRQCNTCGHGLQRNERGPTCFRCVNNLGADGGVEIRGDVAGGILPAVD